MMNQQMMNQVQKHEIYQQCVDFLSQEADMLDRRKFDDWLELLTDDVVYKVPVRVTRELDAETEFSSTASLMDETRGSLQMRIKRIHTEFNWAESPASRTRHFVSNFKMDSCNESGTEVQMRSNLLLFRNRFDSPTSDLLSAEKVDTLRKVNDQWKLAKRIVYLDHSVLPTNNLAIFF